MHPAIWIKKKPPMNPAIWGKIPDEVIVRILSFLPVPVRVRFSAVCKLWNSAVFSPNSGETPAVVFQWFKAEKRNWREPPPPRLAVYDILDKRWYSITLDFIPRQPERVILNYSIVSASGGLLCIRPNDPWDEVGLILCNPVTRNWVDLPCRGHHGADVVVMHVDNAKRYYKVLVARTGYNHTTELYDSRNCKWTLTEKSPSSRETFKAQMGCLCGSNAYLLYKTMSGEMSGERDPCLEIDVYDMEQEKWKPSLPAPAERFKPVNLLNCNGRLMLIGRFCKDPSKDEIVIWEFTASIDALDSSWREAERMPEDANEFLGISIAECSWVSRGDQIFLIGAFCNPIVVYDVLKRTWDRLYSNLPKFMDEKPYIRFETGIAFDLCPHRF